MKRRLMIMATLAMIAINVSSCVVHERTYAYRGGGRDYGYNRMRGHHHHHYYAPGVTIHAR